MRSERHEHRPTQSGDNETFPMWSQTGSRLAYVRHVGTAVDRTPTSEIVVVTPATGETVRLAPPSPQMLEHRYGDRTTRTSSCERQAEPFKPQIARASSMPRTQLLP